MKLRGYQQDAVRSCWKYWREGKGVNPLVVAPTGSGKSHIIAEIASKVAERKCKVILVTHRKELLVQDAQKIIAAGFTDIGFFGASFGRKDFATITCAQIQSLAKCIDIPKFDLAIIDEAHLVPESGTGQYRNTIEKLKLINPKLRVLGLTATPYRKAGGMLDGGDDKIFDGTAYNIDIRGLIDDGWLAKPIPFGATDVEEFDIRNLVSNGGDYQVKQQDEETSRLAHEIAGDIVLKSRGRENKKVLIFCAGVAGCEAMKAQFDRMLWKSEVVVGTTPPELRRDILKRYTHGDLQYLISCDVLTTGFDAPQTNVLALVRATQSPGLYVQMVGRGMRMAEGKTDCLVLDYGKNVERHGPIDAIEIRKKSGKPGQIPLKKCIKCHAYMRISLMVCEHCGTQQPEPKQEKYTEKAGKKELLKSEWVDVFDVRYQLGGREGKPPYLRIIYDTPYREYSEFLMPEHGGYPRRVFDRRIREWFNSKANTVGDCLEECNRWPVPRRIRVRKDGDFWKVQEWDFKSFEMDPPPPEPEEDPDIEMWRDAF